MGLSFNPNGSGSWNDLLSGSQSTAPQQQPQGGQHQAQQGPGQPQQKFQAPKAPKK